MKNFLIFCCLISFLKSIPQQPIAPGGKSLNKNTEVNTGTKKLGSQNTVQNLVSTLKHDTCLDKKFSLVFYIIQDSIYSRTPITLPLFVSSIITPKVNYLNNLFKRICVSFEHCKTVIIPNYTFNKWTAETVDPIVTSTWFTENTINVYIPEKIESSLCQDDYGYMPDSPSVNSPKNVIVTRNLTDGNLAHAFGHFFGLQHTFAEIHPSPPALPAPSHSLIISHEFVDRSNCSTNGDGICDTEADQYPWMGQPVSKYHAFCAGFIGDVKDGKGNYYTPPLDNFMSYYTDCRCRFTQEQYNRMAYIILTKRLYLH